MSRDYNMDSVDETQAEEKSVISSHIIVIPSSYGRLAVRVMLFFVE